MNLLVNVVAHLEKSSMSHKTRVAVPHEQSQKLNSIPGICHGFYKKLGGVSSGIYDSLNCGPSSQDKPENVAQNRARVMHSLGLESAQLFGLHQIHSTRVHQVTPDSDASEYPQGDGLVTRHKGLALSVLGADCTPILFASPQGVIGAAHAGWKGAVTGMVESMVTSMCDLGAQRDDIIACIGPTIHQASYEVRDDFIKQLNALSDLSSQPFLAEKEGRYYFDLPGYLLAQCKRSGIQAESLGLDTYDLKDEFFSYRRNTHAGIKDYGRQISVISII